MNLHKLTSSYFILCLIIAGFSSGCGKESVDPPKEDYSTILTSLTNDVIVATYNNLNQNANTLQASVSTLKNDPTADNLIVAKNAWINTREHWEKSEGFLFGPVDTEGIDPSIDSWPVNQVDLENVLASSDELNKNYVTSLEGTLKGFHTIEFLLWGADGTKSIGDFNEREFEYLIATVETLASDANTLADFWNSSGGNFASNLINAGESGSIYISQKAALEELANGILGIADEVGNGKINDPLEQEDFALEESQFSDNSKKDFADNIRSIQNIYVGLSGSGLSDIVAKEDGTLDTQIKTEIQAAIDAIQNIPGTFTEAIPVNSPTRAHAENAQAAVRQLQATLESGLIPLISGL